MVAWTSDPTAALGPDTMGQIVTSGQPYTPPPSLPPVQYVAPATTAAAAQPAAGQPAIGTTGISFGGGQFAWAQHADGTWGWKASDGRTWDPSGNPYTVQAQPAQPAAPNGLDAQKQVADPLVDWFRTHSGINVQAYNFNKLKQSTQDVTLAAAEAAGHDKADVFTDIQRTLPRATGPRTGYVAPLGTR